MKKGNRQTAAMVIAAWDPAELPDKQSAKVPGPLYAVTVGWESRNSVLSLAALVQDPAAPPDAAGGDQEQTAALVCPLLPGMTVFSQAMHLEENSLQ